MKRRAIVASYRRSARVLLWRINAIIL